MFVGKIYAKDKDTLVLENVGKEVYKTCYPYGRTSRFFRKGAVIMGAHNIAISKEGKELFCKIVDNANRVGEGVSDLDVFNTDLETVCITWLGKNKHEINLKKLDKFTIGCGERAPKLELLDKLVLMDNEKLKHMQLFTEKVPDIDLCR